MVALKYYSRLKLSRAFKNRVEHESIKSRNGPQWLTPLHKHNALKSPAPNFSSPTDTILKSLTKMIFYRIG